MNTALSVENLQTFFTDEGQIPAVNGVSLTLARSRVAVMYAGKIVELGQTEQIFTDPKHPSIRALLAAVPDVPMNFDLGGEVADAGRFPPGCSFHPRHPRRFEPCDKVVPALRPVDGTTCHLYGARER